MLLCCAEASLVHVNSLAAVQAKRKCTILLYFERLQHAKMAISNFSFILKKLKCVGIF